MSKEKNPYMLSEDDLDEFLKLSERDRFRVIFRAVANLNQTAENMACEMQKHLK